MDAPPDAGFSAANLPAAAASANAAETAAPQTAASSSEPARIAQAGVQTVAYEQPADPAAPLEELAPADFPVLGSSDAATLSLPELEQMALGNNPALAAAAAEVRAARGRWLQAGLPPNPTLGYTASEIGDAGSAGQQGGLVGQQFITGGKLGLAQAVVAQEIAREQREWAAVELRVLTDVRLAYYDALIAQRRVDLAQKLLGISTQAATASQELLQAGDIPRIGLLQTEIEARNTQIVLRRAENERRAAWQRLTSVVGLPQLAETRLAGDLEATQIEFDFESQLERLMQESPEIAAAMADVARSRWAVDRAYAEVVPDITTQASVMQDTSTGDTLAGVQVSLPLPLWNKNQGGIYEAQQQVMAAERNVARAELDVRRRLAVAFRAYADARYQVGVYSSEILPKAQETLDLVSTGYRAGEVGYLDLLTAQRTYFETALSYLDVLGELWRSAVRIEGLLLEGSLQGGGGP